MNVLVACVYAVSVVASFVVLVNALWDGRWLLAVFAFALMVLAIVIGSSDAPR